MKILLIAIWSAAFAVTAAESRPNILFLFADDQRADTIAAHGNPAIKTPNLDRLAKGGLSFSRAYMQGAMNGATCVPSRAMLLSGRNLFHIDENLRKHPTWPDAFGKAGYDTFMTGKWHNGPDSITSSFQSARAVFTGGMTNPMKAPLSDLVDGKPGPAKVSDRHACEVFADEAIRFIRGAKDKPFFCYVPFDAPHDPHIVPEDFPVNYEPAEIPLQPEFLPRHPWDNGEMNVRDEKLLKKPLTPESVRAFNAEYYRYVSYLDSQVGRILDALAESPHDRNTIIVYAADSGVARGSHGLIGKQNLYEHSVRVPLIMAGPGIPKSANSEAMCYLFDVMPTLGQFCKVPAPPTSEGIGFSDTIADPAVAAREQLMFAYKDVQRAVCNGQWKLIRYPKVDRVQLFDLENDPHEVHDLSKEPSSAGKLAEMEAMLKEQQVSMGDPLKL